MLIDNKITDGFLIDFMSFYVCNE